MFCNVDKTMSAVRNASGIVTRRFALEKAVRQDPLSSEPQAHEFGET